MLQAFPGGEPTAGVSRTVLHDDDPRVDAWRRERNHVDDVLSLPSRRLRDIVAEHAPDVVNTHNLSGIGTGIWEVSRRAAVPVVHALHDYHLLCPRATLRRIDGSPCRPSPYLCGLRSRRMARWAAAVSHVIGVSRFLLDRHSGFFPAANGHVVRHPPRALGTRGLPPPGARLARIGYIGSLEPIKGVAALLDAIPALAAHGVGVSFAGSGRLAADVEAAARRFEGVRYLGQVAGEAKAAFFASCDLGAVPSVWDEPGGPSWTAIEWLAAGRPVLLSARGGLREGLERFSGTIEVEPTGSGILAAVEPLLEPSAWRAAVEAVQPVTEEGAPERWAAEYESVFEQAVSRPRAGAR